MEQQYIPKFRPGDIVYIPATDNLWDDEYIPMKHLGQVATIETVSLKGKDKICIYHFRFLFGQAFGNSHFHTTYDLTNSAERNWVKLEGTLETIKVLYGH